jgi:CP family cyanate transporter-like MFS transporter
MNNNIHPTQARPQTESSDHQQVAAVPVSRWLLLFILFLVGMNLRPALSSVASVLSAIRAGTGLSSTGAGLLTTLPILCFGLIAPFAPRLARSFSVEKAIFYCLLALSSSMAFRIFFGIPGLFIGTLVAGASIGIVMVLLMGLIKRDFPNDAEMTTGVYTMALCFGASLAAGITVPLQNFASGDWRLALAFWTVPALIAAAAWWPLLRQSSRHGQTTRYQVSGLGKSALAWQVTIYLCFQSALAYCVFGWLPTILIDRGISPLAAGFLLSLSIGMQLITSLIGPWIATRGRDQRAAIVVMLMLTLAGLLGCVFAPVNTIWFWSIMLGLGQGGSFSIAMALIVLRSPNTQVAAALSGMSQGVGYSAAAIGPLAVGLLHDVTHGWNEVAIFFVIVTVVALIAALGAGRNLQINAQVTPAN